MARSNKYILSGNTIIDVVARNKVEIVVKEMTINEFRNIKKRIGWNYQVFQKGFHTYKNEKI